MKKNSSAKQADDASSKKRKDFVRALDLVLKEVAKHHAIGQRQFKVSVEEDSEGWFVCITFLPRTPSNELLGRVKRDGEVTIVSGL